MRSEYINYSDAGAYFVTICTKDKEPMFWDMEKFNPEALADDFNESVGAIINRPHALCPMSSCGALVETYINDISNHYNNLVVDKYVIMPDHIHMILIILPDENGRLLIAPTISRVIKQLKSVVTKQIGSPVWQKSYYDHVIRDRKDYDEICKYIHNNPLKLAYETIKKGD